MADAGALLLEQIDFYWNVHLWPRLEGLTDEEYFWEPVPGCWSVRKGPDGRWAIDDAPTTTSPVTTIAWRLNHITSGIHIRVSAFFDDPDPAAGGDMFHPRHQPAQVPGTAGESLAVLDTTFHRWYDELSALGPEGMDAPLGTRGGQFADDPMVALLAHVNRETMHHGGEIGVLRDLYRETNGRPLVS